MDTTATETELLYEQIEDYAKTSVELIKLRAVEKVTVVAVSVVSKISVAVTALLFLIVITVGTALWLGELLGKPYYGFFAVGSFIFLVVLLLYLRLQKWLHKPLSNRIIQNLLS